MAWDAVRAYLREHPGRKPGEACKALGIRRGIYDTAKHRLKLAGYDECDDVEAFDYSDADQIRPNDPIVRAMQRGA
jgi:hypothetical protein